MLIDPILTAALRHWGVRAVPFSDSAGETPFLTPATEQTLRLLLGLNLPRQPVFALILIGDLHCIRSLGGSLDRRNSRRGLTG